MSTQTESELLRINNQLCRFSLDSRFLAIAYQTNLLIKNTGTFDTFQSFLFNDVIEYIEWSPNSQYILCANIKRAIIQVYSIYYPEWKCKLTEGSAGLESVTWSPDSKCILTLAEFNIQVSVWSLENRSVTHIQKLKSSSFDELKFSPNGNRLALIITDEGEDSVEIYKTNQWKISRKLICDRLKIIDGICWSPNNELLCIWCALEAKLIIYSITLDKNIGTFCPTKRANSHDSNCDYFKEFIGIESVKWMPSGQLLAVTGLNEMVLLLNYVTWRPILQLNFDPVITQNSYLNKVYKESLVETKNNKSNARVKHTLEEEHERPLNIKIDKQERFDKFSVAKTDILEFSPCGQYLAVKHELYPTTLWIWNVVADYVDYLLLKNTIVAIKWNPTRPQLFAFCECAHMFEWTPNNAKCTPTPRGITAVDAQWHPQGKIAALCGYNKAVIYQIDDN